MYTFFIQIGVYFTMSDKIVVLKTGLKTSELAKILNLTRATVNKWIKDGDIVIPAKYCPAVRVKTGIPLSELNPFVFNQEWLDFENKHWGNK
jgi:DNA-binding transcriptional regulator YdaS (Cro superfamily)